MSISWDAVKDFWDYIECYPYEDEEGYDGIHNGGIKCISKNAPKSAKLAYEKYVKIQKETETKGIKF